MSDAQRRSYENFSPQFCIPFQNDPLDYKTAFGNENTVTVEIGFGMGVATAIIAEQNPGKNYLCLEVHRPGIGRLLWEIENRRLANIRIIEHDAAEVFEKMIRKNSAAALHIFFPDPWPKKRHHKRRLIKRPFTDVLAASLKSGAYLYMVTDWENYGEWALEELSNTIGLKNQYDGFAPRQDWRPQTKFEKKGLAKNHRVNELYFIKTDGE
ncbi:MAG: tRNA (guanosine(46)-N7)-methyltransferase TrmB [Treponema sp.]|nr:tRNA (guanosine(46)-N7)-methyltransferase TrmB [Treponema sp.]